MAFDHVTFFEVHVDGTEFGSKSGGTVETDDEPTTADVDTAQRIEERPGAGSKRRYAAVIGLAAVGGILARRLRHGRRAPDTVDVDVAGPESADATAEESVAK